MNGRVGPVARVLGFAGLLPQAAAVVLAAMRGEDRIGKALALGYGALILSFLGGMWWTMAMRRTAGQGPLALVAVAPSLVALAIGLALAAGATVDHALVALGIAIVATLAVDRWLVRSGEAPDGWLGLRVPLSIGLGGLTILAALI